MRVMKRWLQDNWEIGALLMVAAIVYRPWDSPVLPLTDFGTFLSLIDTSQSLLSQLVTVTSYYINEGRICLFQYVHIVLATNAFGVWAPGWHWTYFAINAAVLLIGRRFFLKTGAGRLASFAALALWATMSPVAEGWIRPTGEPIALVFFLMALLLAVNFADAPDWRRRVLLIAGCAVGIIFSKEMLVVLLPVGWLVSRLRVDATGWSWATWSNRDNYLLAAVTIAVVAALLPVAYFAVSAPKGNYASQYGTLPSLGYTALRIESVLIPTGSRLRNVPYLLRDPGWMLLLVLPSLLWIRMVVGGIVAGPRQRLTWPIIIALLWTSIGIVAYLPWPARGGFYMLPFAFAAMFGAAHALNGLFAKGRSERAAGVLVVALLLTINAAESRSILYRFQLRARLNSQVIEKLAVLGRIDLLVAAVPRPVPDGKFGLAGNIKGFGEAATPMRVARAMELRCSDAARLLPERPGMVVVSVDGACGPISPASVPIVASVPRAVWPRLWAGDRLSGRMYITHGPASPAMAASASREAEPGSARN